MLGTGPAVATASAATSSNVSVLQQFASGLKSRNEETRAKAAKELQHYVTMELREVGLVCFGASPCWVLGLMLHHWFRLLLWRSEYLRGHQHSCSGSIRAPVP